MDVHDDVDCLGGIGMCGALIIGANQIAVRDRHWILASGDVDDGAAEESRKAIALQGGGHDDQLGDAGTFFGRHKHKLL